MCGPATRVDVHAPGNQIPAPSDAGHDWLPLRGLAGVLAGRLDPRPTLLSRHGRARTGVDKGYSFCGSSLIFGPVARVSLRTRACAGHIHPIAPDAPERVPAPRAGIL